MRYAPTVEYVQGSQNHLADALSRAPVERPSAVDMILIDDLETYAKALLTTDPRLTEYTEAQHLDPVCQEIMNSLKKGWAAYKTDANKAIHPYWDEKGHFTEVNGTLLYDQRIVVLAELRLKTLERIHQAHQGEVKCLERARRAV